MFKIASASVFTVNSQVVLLFPTHFLIVYNLKKTNVPFPKQTTGSFPTMNFPVPVWTAKFFLEGPGQLDRNINRTEDVKIIYYYEDSNGNVISGSSCVSYEIFDH